MNYGWNYFRINAFFQEGPFASLRSPPNCISCTSRWCCDARSFQALVMPSSASVFCPKSKKYLNIDIRLSLLLTSKHRLLKVTAPVPYQLQDFINACLSSQKLGLTEARTNVSAHAICLLDVLIKRRIWQWVGHILAKTDNSIANYAIKCHFC